MRDQHARDTSLSTTSDLVVTIDGREFTVDDVQDVASPDAAIRPGKPAAGVEQLAEASSAAALRHIAVTVPEPSPPGDLVVPVSPIATDTIDVGPFRLADITTDEFIATTAAAAVRRLGRAQTVAFALHVGGLLERHDVRYLAAMHDADIVYADGMSIILLSKIAGAQRIERASTTDTGQDILREMSTQLGRRTRVAIVGGQPGLAEKAGRVLTESTGCEIVHTENGYLADWSDTLAAIRAAAPDVVLVGMGAPKEMAWVSLHRDELPMALILTCGGWFGFLTSDEKRAPSWMQRIGAEWIIRLVQAPTRLGPRYAKGLVVTSRLALEMARQRRAAH